MKMNSYWQHKSLSISSPTHPCALHTGWCSTLQCACKNTVWRAQSFTGARAALIPISFTPNPLFNPASAARPVSYFIYSRVGF